MTKTKIPTRRANAGSPMTRLDPEDRPVGKKVVKIHGAARIADFLTADPLAVHASIKQGFGFQALEDLQHTFNLTQSEVIHLVQIPERTLARRRVEGRLRPVESDRLLRIARLFDQAVTLFEGDTTEARGWLSRPQRVLGGAVPLELATTEVGAQEVERALLRIEHGVFA